MINRLDALRKEMKNRDISAYIIPTADPHMSEYLAEHWQIRKWISGFTGSAGTVVVTADKAGLWTDGRYYIQAEKELEGSGIELFKLHSPGVPDHISWLLKEMKNGNRIGIFGKLLSSASYKDMEKKFSSRKIDLVTEYDLIDLIWKDRPQLPDEIIDVHAQKFAGKSRIEKLKEIRVEMTGLSAAHYLISALDEIAWTLNIRGNDIDFNPVTIAYMLISPEKSHLFISSSKIPQTIVDILLKDNIQIHEYEEIDRYLNEIRSGERVIFDPKKTNQWLVEQLGSKVEKIEKQSIIALFKSKKNQIEIENFRNSLQRDCVALVKFFYWLENNLGKIKITEISAAEKLAELRAQQDNFRGLSFPAISAYGPNAAMMHYSPGPGSNATLKQEGLYLIDSGGQYSDGTTDITRTIALGPISEEQKKDFTLVLKAHIGLSTAVFLKDSTGANLDILARLPLWQEGIDYKCGTGHGVGYFLNVHEGPQNFSQVMLNVPFEQGMITTNEPGIYREGKWGIRTENMLLAVHDRTTEFGEFLKFETLSYCPIDLNAILPEMLSESEKEWLNQYHEQVYKKLNSDLSSEEQKWLRERTRYI